MNKRCRKCGKVKNISSFFKNKTCKDGYLHSCKECQNEHVKKYYATYPWLKTYLLIRSRCGVIRKYRNRKNLISKEELKFLWFRDKAYNMKRPSIDRKDNDGDYTLKNCRYMELSKNASLGNMGNKNACKKK